MYNFNKCANAERSGSETRRQRMSIVKWSVIAGFSASAGSPFMQLYGGLLQLGLQDLSQTTILMSVLALQL
jgi:hypothetical protein